MHCTLDQYHLNLREQFRAFARREIKPLADQIDQEEHFPPALIGRMAAEGLLGCAIGTRYGGKGYGPLAVGLLHQEIGRVCSSARSLLTVHASLVGQTLERWGTESQKERWLPPLTAGRKVAAFCLTEENAGSDAASLGSVYEKDGSGYVLNGSKKWTTFGQVADVFLFFARQGEALSAFLVDRHAEGVRVTPVRGMLGTRGSMIADVQLTNCRVGEENLLGRAGMGFTTIANTALDNGRFSVAFGSLGIALACLEDSVAYAKQRRQFGHLLKDYQLIKRKIAAMITETKAATLLCYNAAALREAKSPDAVIQVSLAKYYAAATANRAASEAVQLHGALGCSTQLPVQRYFRDAKIMEIIEGTAEIQQILIADYGLTSLRSILD